MWAVLKFELVRWSRASGTIAVPIGAFILAVFLALFKPDALGQGDAERDRTDRGQASLAAARQQTQILQSNCKWRRHTGHLLEQANTLVNYCRASRFI
jgi:hypothetical protein